MSTRAGAKAGRDVDPPAIGSQCPTCGQVVRKLREPAAPKAPKRTFEELCDAVVDRLARENRPMKGIEIATAIGYPPRPRLHDRVRHVLVQLAWGGVLDVVPFWQYQWTGRRRVWDRHPEHVLPRTRAWRWRGPSRAAGR